MIIPHDSPCEPSAQDRTLAARNVEAIAERLIVEPKRKFAPIYSLLVEVLVLLLVPQLITRPSGDKGGIGARRRTNEGVKERLRFGKWKQNTPKLDKLTRYTEVKKAYVNLVSHARASSKLPTQAAVSTAFQLDRKKG